MQFCRCFSFVEALKLEHVKRDRLALLQSDSLIPTLSEQAILELKNTTLKNASDYAARFFPDVEFEIAPADEVPFTIEDDTEQLVEFAFADREPTEAELDEAANYVLRL